MPKLPSFVFAIVFSLMLVLTQLLTYQQYKISIEKQKNELTQEAAAAKDRFRNILVGDIAVAKTLAVIYKQYGVPAKFDSVASQILNHSPYAQALQITENGTVMNAYPDVLYKGTIGTNVNDDPIRKAEEERAEDRKDIYFAGPRRLRFGDTGILGKVPILKNNKVIAVATVLTRIDIIKKALANTGINKKKFAYQLIKSQNGQTSPFPMSDAKPAKESDFIDNKIPEGDWLLRTSYAEGYAINKFPYELSGMGLLLSFVVGLLAYRRAREPYKLNKIIDVKTAQLNKANKELNLLNEINDIILDEDDIDTLYHRVCSCIVESGRYEMAWIRNGEDASTVTPSVTLPFEEGGHKISELCIYTEQTDAIDEDEIIMLNRLVSNLSIAVQHIQNRVELAESENRFRGAFEDSAIGMGLTSIAEDSLGKWLKVNKALCNMLGYSEEELLARTFMQITHPDDIAMDLAAQDKLLQGESGTYRLDKRYLHKDGSIIWISLNVSLVKNKDKHPLYLVTQVENISEKIESQSKFQNLVENFTVGVYIVQNGKIVYVNPRIVEEFGYLREEIINKQLETFIYPDDIEMVRQNIKERLETDGKSNSRYEVRIVNKEGKPLWFEVLGGTTLYRGQPALIGTMINITERKAVYDELERSEKRYSNLFNFSPLPAWVAEVGTLRFLDVNNAAIAHYGYSREEFLSMTLRDIRPAEELENMYGTINEHMAQKDGIFHVIMTHQKKNGELMDVEIQVAPIHYAEFEANMAIGTDITERQNYIHAIEAQNERLREISWIQSHTVRAPLSRIMGLAHMLEDLTESTEEQKKVLNYLLTSANELDEIIKAITDKSKI